MENKIKIRRVVETEVPLLHKPTDEELLMIKNDEMFDIDDLFYYSSHKIM